MKQLLVTLIVISFIGSLQGSLGKPGYGPGDQDWDWYEVRKGAHLFYWLFYTQATDVLSPYDKPLVIWLSGIPGISVTGYCNFGVIGPLFANGTKRPSSWVNYVNLLFVDNPLGTGYSYVTSGARLATNSEEIGVDMVQYLIRFYEKHPKFSSSHLYIFGEKLWGKLTVEIAKQLDIAIKENRLNADFRGIALGGSNISPVDSLLNAAPYLLQTGLVDIEGHHEIAKAAKLAQNSLDSQDYVATENLLKNFAHVVFKETGNVNLQNILYPVKYNERNMGNTSRNSRQNWHRSYEKRSWQDDLDVLMQNDVRQVLKIPEYREYKNVNPTVRSKIKKEWIKSVTSVVEELLNNTNLKVELYNGQLDAQITTFGTLQWMDRLEWSGSPGWKSAKRNPIVVDGIIEGYVKNYRNLYFYWIYRSGKYVTEDNPAAGIELLRKVTESGSESSGERN